MRATKLFLPVMLIVAVGIGLAPGCSDDDPVCPGYECWAEFFLHWESDSLESEGWITQGVTIKVPPGAYVKPGSAVHWKGPETLEPTFLDSGTVEDGDIEVTYPIFGVAKNIGDWTAKVVLALECRREAFIRELPFVIEGEIQP